MPKFSQQSLSALSTTVKEMQELMGEAIHFFNFQVLEGHRDKAAQDIAFAKGVSQQRWPNSKHNSIPSKAVDVAPWPVDWADTEKARQRFCLLAGIVICIATQKSIFIRWGGDWNNNLDTRDERFRDYGHFEIV